MKSFFTWVYKRRLLWLIVVCLIGITLDQVSKIWAQSYLAESYQVFEEPIIDGDKTIKKFHKVYYPIRIVEVIPEAFNLIYKENTAAAFSLTESIPLWFRRPMLITISLIAGLFFTLWYFRLKQHESLLIIAFSFILAGALGNFIDRIRLGYVIDFLDVHAAFLGYPHLHWPTFNVADSLIVIGAVLVFFSALKPNQETARVS